ncbi:MAG: HAD family hydrolase [bacterium]
MKYIDLIIFDLDGTLVDSRDDIANAVNFTLKKIGLKEKSISEISSYIGTGVEGLIRKSLGNKEEVLLKKALSAFEEYYKKHSTDNSVLYPNVKEILEYFKGKKKVIVTNRNYEFALLTLKTLGIYDYFEDIVGGDDIGCMKPSSCPLDMSMHRLNANKEEAIIVGDMDLDIVAGKRAGIITCGVTYGIGKKEDIIKAKPDFIIDDIMNLKNLIH